MPTQQPHPIPLRHAEHGRAPLPPQEREKHRRAWLPREGAGAGQEPQASTPKAPSILPGQEAAAPAPRPFVCRRTLLSIQPPVNEPQHEKSNQPRRSPASSNLPPSLLCINFPGCGFSPLIPHSFIHERNLTGGTAMAPKRATCGARGRGAARGCGASFFPCSTEPEINPPGDLKAEPRSCLGTRAGQIIAIKKKKEARWLS